MTAPALVAFAPAAVDSASARTVREIVATTRRLRRDLPMTVAFASGAKPDLPTAVATLADRGHGEVVVLPLLVAANDPEGLDLTRAIDAAALANPRVHVRAAEPLGADPGLLPVLDARLREALRQARVRELDAMVLASAGSSDSRVTVAITRLARLWSAHHHLPTSVAFAEASPPSTGEAVRDWRRQGKRHIAVASLFITSGPRAARAAELAYEAGARVVSSPLGAHEELSRLIVARYSVSALELVPV